MYRQKIFQFTNQPKFWLAEFHLKAISQSHKRLISSELQRYDGQTLESLRVTAYLRRPIMYALLYRHA